MKIVSPHVVHVNFFQHGIKMVFSKKEPTLVTSKPDQQRLFGRLEYQVTSTLKLLCAEKQLFLSRFQG